MASMAKLDSLASHGRLRPHVKEVAYVLRRILYSESEQERSGHDRKPRFNKNLYRTFRWYRRGSTSRYVFHAHAATKFYQIWLGNQKIPGCLGRALAGTFFNGVTLRPLHGEELNQKCANIILAAYTAAHIQKYDGPWPFPAQDGNEEVDLCTKWLLYLALANFKQISLLYSVQSDGSQISSNWIQHQDAFANTVTSNNALEHLSLSISDLHTLRYHGPQFTFARLFGDCAFFPNFKSLDLWNFKVSQAALEAFLASHSTTLERLDLVDIELVPRGKDAETLDRVNSWPTFFHFLRQNMSLDVIWLEGWLTIIDKSEG